MEKSFLNSIITENSEKEVDNSFTNFLHGFKKVKSLKESLNTEALSKELSYFIESNSEVNDQISSVKKTLFKHFKKGEYDSSLAERAWDRVISEGAKKYAEDIGKEPRLWENLFPENIRQPIVEEFEQKFYQDLKKGKVNVEELFNE